VITPKQERFTEEYLKDFNGKRAAIRTGYSPHSAEVQASRLLSKAKIQAVVEQKKAQQCTHLGLTRERVLNEIRRLAFSDPGELFNETGELADIRTLSADVRATIASVKVLKTNLVSGDGVRERLHEVKQWDKTKALEMAAKHLGMLDETVKHEGAVELVVSWKTPPSATSEQVIDVTQRAISGNVKEGE